MREPACFDRGVKDPELVELHWNTLPSELPIEMFGTMNFTGASKIYTVLLNSVNIHTLLLTWGTL